MVAGAACVRLQTDARDLPILAEAIHQEAEIVAVRHGRDKAALAFERPGGGGEAALRKLRGEQAALRRPTCVERLAHRAEDLAEAGRLRRGDAERVRHLL